jgi:hypothetical protein
METTLTHTGNPWIDCGIIGLCDLWKDKSKIQPEGDVNVHWRNDQVVLEAANPEELNHFLESTFEEIKSTFYIERTRNSVCILDRKKRQFKVVPKINLVSVVGFLFSGGDLKVKYGAKEPLETGLMKKYEEFRRLYKGRRNVDFKVKKDEKNKKEYVYASEPRYNWPFKIGKEGVCSFCGRRAPCVDIDSNNYPFAVGTNNFQNFFSNLSLSPKMCLFCELASLVAINRIIFNLTERRRRLFLAIPQAYSLGELYDFWHLITSNIVLKPLNRDSNLLSGGYRYRRLSESVLATCLELYLQLERIKEDAKRIAEADKLKDKVSSKSWHFFMVSKTGQVLLFDSYTYLTDLHRIFKLFASLGNPHTFKEMFQHLAIQQGREWRNELRDQFAQRILRSAGLNNVAERIMWGKSREGSYVAGLADFIEHYNIWRG